MITETAGSSELRVLVADDHTIVRKGLKELLTDSFKSIEVDEAASGIGVLKKIRKKDYDVLLLDISMPGRSGLDILKQIKCMKPKTHVLMLTVHTQEHYAIRALRAGASGYLTKNCTTEEMKKAVRRVAKGQKYIIPFLAEKLALNLNTQTRAALHETLSDREFQVMCMISSGKAVSQIAKALHLNVKTISTFRARILKKMNMENNAQLTHYAIQHSLNEECAKVM